MSQRRRANISTSCGRLKGDLAGTSVDEFYRLARALLVKDERNLDKFDIVFAATFKGVLSSPPRSRPGPCRRNGCAG